MPMSSSCCIAMSITTSNPALKALLSYWYVSNVWGQWARCFFVLRVSTPGCLMLINGRLLNFKMRPIKTLYDSLGVVMDEVREHYRGQFREQLATMLRSASKAQKIRRLQPLIERYLLDGASHQVVAEDLSVAGLEISRQVFTVTLNRVRAESIEDAPKAPQTTSVKPAPNVQPKHSVQQKQTIESPAD